MRFHGQPTPSLFPLVSLLTLIFLLSAGGPAFADPRGKSHDGSYAGGDGGRHGGWDKSYKKMHSSGHGNRSGKGHGGHGHEAMLSGAHQEAKQFIKHLLKNKDGMSLTNEQVRRLRDLKINHEKSRIMMQAEADIAKLDLRVLMKDEKSKLSDVEAQMNAVHGFMTKLHVASIKAKRDAKAVLTDEQRARMDKIHKRIRSHGASKGHSGDSSKNCKKSKGHETDGHKQ